MGEGNRDSTKRDFYIDTILTVDVYLNGPEMKTHTPPLIQTLSKLFLPQLLNNRKNKGY